MSSLHLNARWVAFLVPALVACTQASDDASEDGAAGARQSPAQPNGGSENTAGEAGGGGVAAVRSDDVGGESSAVGGGTPAVVPDGDSGRGYSGAAPTDGRDAAAGAPSNRGGAPSAGASATRLGEGGTRTGDGHAGRGGAGGDTESVPPEASVPAQLVGIWQETRASSGDYTNAYGQDFSMTSGFSVQLKIAPDGSYYLAHFASGVSASCAHVTHFEQSVGIAALEGATLTLRPSERRLDVQDCSGSTSLDLGTDPVALDIVVSDAWHEYGHIRTWSMQATGGPHPYDLMLVHRAPLGSPAQPDQPSDFVLGEDPPYAELQGFWVGDDGTDSQFFDPETGDFYFPELNGSPHQWLRFAGDGYETALALQGVNSDGPCKSDVIYYEQGTALFSLLEDVGGQGSHFVGHVRLEATRAHLVVRVRECDADDRILRYDLPVQTSYYRWIYFSPDAPPERISFPCDFPATEWQPTLCEAFESGFYRSD
ncbi:MAG: hypothetical protein JW940_20465 [Polyangiaceae bacterium]|nr:hypothetical protein [Polyangiaceae bacterium]